MLRGCLLSLAFYAALVVGYHYWFSRDFEGYQTWIAAAVAGFVCFCCLGALQNARRGWKDLSLLSEARHGLPLSDGRRVAVCGEIHPIGEPVIAPFSGKECVLCEYDFARLRPASSEGDPGKDFTGFLMNPCVIRAPMGDVKLLGFPDLAEFPQLTCHGLVAARRAREFLRATTFDDNSGLKFVGVLSALQDVWADDDGLVRKNMRLAKADATFFSSELNEMIDRLPADATDEYDDEEDEEDEEADYEEDDVDLEGEAAEDEEEFVPVPSMTEKRVRVGTPVCAIGVYQSEKRGLLPPRGSGKLNRLLPGTEEDLRSLLGKQVWGYFWGGLVGLVVLHVAALGIMAMARNSPREVQRRERAAFEAATNGQVEPLRKLLDRGLDVNVRDTVGRTLLMLAQDPQVVALLLSRGSNVNAIDQQGETALLHAAQAGNAEKVRQLIAAKADLNYRDPRYQYTALVAADRGEHREVADLLRQAGAIDEVITAQNGTPLPRDGGAPLVAIKAYLQAIQNADVATLRELSPGGSGKFEGVDWDVWRSARIAQITSVKGYQRGDEATVTLQGTSGGGYATTWVYQMKDEGKAGWKIAREQWEVK